MQLSKPYWYSSLSSGFTLIEVLVVLGIIGVLAASVLATLNPIEQIKKANDSQRKSDLAQIQRGLELWYQDHNAYPEETKVNPLWGSGWSENGVVYMSKLPKDKKDPDFQYVYVCVNNCRGYRLYASLERASDPQLCNPDGSACPNAPIVTCGGGHLCNFGVSSSNTKP